MQPRTVEFRFLAEPTHVNFGGKVHGGMVMKWLDQAAYACAARWSGLYCVTVSVGTIRFRRPILVGHLVELEAKVVHTGSTSMHIFVQVRSGDSKSGELAETNHCIITFVALDEQGNTVGYEDVHTKIEMCRRHYQAVGLGADYVERFIR